MNDYTWSLCAQIVQQGLQDPKNAQKCPKMGSPRSQKCSMWLRPGERAGKGSTLMRTCFLCQLSHQRASSASSLINVPPLQALSSTGLLCQLSHQRASFASSLINVLPLPALSSTCLLCQLSHQRASFASSLINVLPLQALSSTCFLCQLSHQRASFASSLIYVLPLSALSSTCFLCQLSHKAIAHVWNQIEKTVDELDPPCQYL